MAEQVRSLKTGIKYKDTPIGKVPVDWKVGAFSELAEINPKRNLRNLTIYPFVEMAAITSQSHRVQYTKLREFKGGGSKFQNGDTLFARITPCTENGKTAYVDFLDENQFGHGSTEFIIFGPKKGVDGKFVYYVAKWDKVRNIAVSKMEGTSGRQRVPSRVFIEDIFVPIPPFNEQKKIAEILTALDEAIEKTDQIIEKIKETKKGLMQRLLTRGIGHKNFKKTEIGEIPE
ncbi:MAG: restriction endonuclease subunit S, partial [bacterium]|nr:restriction endonuclease subunit S [bacterium]